MTCPCGAEFCYVCCKPYKQCKTPYQCCQKHKELAVERAHQEEQDRVRSMAIETAGGSVSLAEGVVAEMADENLQSSQMQWALERSRRHADQNWTHNPDMAMAVFRRDNTIT